MTCVVFENAQHVQRLVSEAVLKREWKNLPCRLVAVSKTKPVSEIISAYQAGIRHFGENYIQELVDKSQDEEIKEKCPDIQWHFIGHLQSNKSKLLSSVHNLSMIETVDSVKLCDKLRNDYHFTLQNRLKVLVQVNSSDEEQKSGMQPEKVVSLVDYIINKCPNLDFRGLMTIGSYSHDYELGENPDFLVLLSCRDTVCKHLGWTLDQMEVSMGMSNDYMHAIAKGSTNVRVGSSIFGARQYKVT